MSARGVMPGFELARYERELNKPPNWGEITYKNLKQRELEKGSILNQTQAPPRSTVRAALEAHATVTGPLDASDVLDTLSEEDILDFFARYPAVRNLILQNWLTISNNVLRCISVTFGEHLIEVDLSNAHFKPPNLEVLFVRSTSLATLKMNNCSTLDTPCTQVIVNLLHKTLVDLYVNSCPHYHTEPLMWIGGVVATGANTLKKLKTLDLGECPVTDRGLLAIAEGCKRLSFLNLHNCTEITDASVAEVAANNPKLKLLNCSGCVKITSKSACAIGRNCPELTSLNLSRCLLITDKGIKTIAHGCRNLQAVNLAGLKKISEESMFALGDLCKGLLTLNLTGCERITINGLNAMCAGLDYVEKGVSFMGFRPVDEHIEKKLADHLAMVQGAAGTRHCSKTWLLVHNSAIITTFCVPLYMVNLSGSMLIFSFSGHHFVCFVDTVFHWLPSTHRQIAERADGLTSSHRQGARNRTPESAQQGRLRYHQLHVSL